MKAISLWQPYASAMALRAKFNETRSWSTPYRGLLAICATQPAAHRGVPESTIPFLASHFRQPQDKTLADTMDRLPYGCVVCVVELKGCLPTVEFGLRGSESPGPIIVTEVEFALGDYTPGRFAWVTTNCRPLKVPLPIRGQQGLWTLTAEQVAEIERRL